MNNKIKYVGSTGVRVNFQRRKLAFIYLICISTLLFDSCKKFVAIAPPETSVVGESAFKSDATAISVITSLYTKMSNEGFSAVSFSNTSTWIAGLSSDEFLYWSGANPSGYYKNELSSTGNGTECWPKLYEYIYACNSAIDGLSNNQTLTPIIKNQLLGEAKFIRAFCYFYLVNMYGDVPLTLSKSYESASSLPRAPKSEVYQQMISDLNEAKVLLSESFLESNLIKVSTERVRPTKSAASALLARIYLYTEKWSDAVAESSILINNSNFQLVSPNSVFLKNSKEAIWQLQPTISGYNTQAAVVLVLPSGGPSGANPIYLSPNMLNSFETNDFRKTNWTSTVTVGSNTYSYSNKYKINQYNVNINSISSLTEYFMVFRLGEQYLIRAEANIKLGKYVDGIDDINKLRSVHGNISPLTPLASQSAMMDILMRERFVELFSEWGHRWFDLKRWGNVESVMKIVTPLKGGVWQNSDQLYPIPAGDLSRDPNLIQNPGY